MKHIFFGLALTIASTTFANDITVSPHWINSGLNNRDLTISPDGNELYSTIMSPANQFAAIVTSRRVDGEWQPLELASFSGEFSDIEPMFSPDGERLYFASSRPKPNREGDDWDIWYVERQAGRAWSAPVNPGAPINSAGNEFYPSVAANGSLYFTAERDIGEGGEDILRAVASGDGDVQIESVGPGVNTKGFEFNAFVAPDESYILFSAQGGREQAIGRGDLYISRRDDSGEFGEAELLPEGVNTSLLDYCPFVHDGRLYFTSRTYVGGEPFNSLDELTSSLMSPGNGLGDIYSVSLDALGI